MSVVFLLFLIINQVRLMNDILNDVYQYHGVQSNRVYIQLVQQTKQASSQKMFIKINQEKV